MVHAALIAPSYHVGSFDDDAGYILTAKALLAGHGLTGHVASGQVVIGLYPPGFSALLAPLLWIWPHDFLALRLLSLAFYLAAFPLTWVYLGRHRVGPALRLAALMLLALGPPFATYATMVMAEAPFIVVLLLLLLAVDRWRDQDRTLTWAGVEVVLLAAALIWLKQAALGLVAGLVIWWPLSRASRRWAKGMLLFGGVALSLVPVVVARVVAGVPLAGARYSEELGGFYQGGLLSRLAHVLPGSTEHLFSTAIPATLVPYLEPLPIQGQWPDLWKVLSWHVSILIAIGAVAWFRRYRDAAVPMTVVYLAESVLWPFVNERRAILVLPLLVTWYVLGAAEVWAGARRLYATKVPALALSAGRLRGPQIRVVGTAMSASLVIAFVAVPLVAQAPRDYLYAWDASSSHFGGARYDAILSALGQPSDVVETDYQSAIALFTGHVTNWSAFISNQGSTCNSAAVPLQLRGDRADYLVVGDFNKPGVLDSPCLLSQATTNTWAVELLHTATDNATVFELVALPSGHPGLTNVLVGIQPTTDVNGPVTTISWNLPKPAAVSQISLGEALAGSTATKHVSVEVEEPGGRWDVVAQAQSGVGDGTANVPFLLDHYTGGPIVSVRVAVTGTDSTVPDTISDLAVIGPFSNSGSSTTS